MAELASRSGRLAEAVHVRVQSSDEHSCRCVRSVACVAVFVLSEAFLPLLPFEAMPAEVKIHAPGHREHWACCRESFNGSPCQSMAVMAVRVDAKHFHQKHIYLSGGICAPSALGSESFG